MACSIGQSAESSCTRPEDTAIPFDQQTGPAQKAAAQRARGEAMLSVGVRDGQTVLRDLRMSGSSKLVFPHGGGLVKDAVYLNTSGGITGGDAFELSGALESGAHLRMTTQAAERIYRAIGPQPGRMASAFSVEDAASLIWLPQETILFDKSALDRHLTIDLQGTARLLACETLVFGRAAMGETVRDIHLRDRIDLRRDGALVFADRLRLDGDAAEILSRAGVADGAGAMASVLWAAPGASARLDTLRQDLPATAGASALDDDLIFLRVLALDSFDLRKTLVPLLEQLAGTDLPRPWML